MQIITLVTDFGTSDHYVGELKGVILGICPDARVVDITHEIQPHNVLQGAFILRRIWPWFPPGTIHLAVVDPGVGSDRRIILGRYTGRYVIAPDNGLVSFVHREFPAETMHVVENRRFFQEKLSATFHGRDIMAPAAAHLAAGVKPGELGGVTDRVEMLPVSYRADEVRNEVHGRVLYVDRFGTLVTNIHTDQLTDAAGPDRASEVLVCGVSIGPIRDTYSDVTAGEPIALIGSAELLEIAINQGSARERFGGTGAVEIIVR